MKSTNKKGAFAGLPSKKQIAIDPAKIPQPSPHRKPRITRKAVQAEFAFLLAAKVGDA